MVEEKKKVYVETSVISNLTARPSHNPIDAALQMATLQWWYAAPNRFALYCSQLVLDEAAHGDAVAASRRLQAVDELKVLPITEDIVKLAEKLLAAAAVPRTSFDDAVHIAAATVHGLDYLVTWNCKHIANAVTMPNIYKVCADAGYSCPLICTPEQMKGE